MTEVAKYIEDKQAQRIQQGRGFPMHKYIHHGLSSQAMLFNVIGPLVIQNDLTPLQKAFQTAEISWPGGQPHLEFEVEDRAIFSEDTGQPTSIL